MDLVYRELKDEAFQPIIMLENCNLVYVRPHILRVGTPGGQLKVQIKDSNGFLIDESNAIDITSIGTLANTHGYVRLSVGSSLRKGEIYQVGVIAFNGYAYSSSDYIGFCRDFDLKKVEPNFERENIFESPFDFELWERKMSDRSAEFFDGFETATPLESITETEAALDNNVGPLDVDTLILDKNLVGTVFLDCSVYRRSDTQEKKAAWKMTAQYKPEAAAWDIRNENDFDNDTGVTFTITAAGQVQYTTTDLVGGNHNGFVVFKSVTTLIPGV